METYILRRCTRFISDTPLTSVTPVFQLCCPHPHAFWGKQSNKNHQHGKGSRDGQFTLWNLYYFRRNRNLKNLFASVGILYAFSRKEMTLGLAFMGLLKPGGPGSGVSKFNWKEFKFHNMISFLIEFTLNLFTPIHCYEAFYFPN